MILANAGIIGSSLNGRQARPHGRRNEDSMMGTNNNENLWNEELHQTTTYPRLRMSSDQRFQTRIPPPAKSEKRHPATQ